ncbi:MAG: SoxR reducing system RseC family protein [Thermodesulfobacteriota bacterium]
MISEYGTVIGLRGDCALIKTSKDTSCESCLSRNSCITTTNETEMIVEADNPVHAKKGDRVLLAVGPDTTIKAGFLLYLIPLACFIAGVLLSNVFLTPLFPRHNPDLVAAAGGGLLLILSFVGLRIYGNRADTTGHKPRIERIL